MKYRFSTVPEVTPPRNRPVSRHRTRTQQKRLVSSRWRPSRRSVPHRAGPLHVLLHDLRRHHRIRNTCSSTPVWLYVSAASSRYVLVYAALRSVMYFLLHDGGMRHTLPRKQHTLSGFYFGSAAVSLRCILASKCDTGLLAMVLNTFPIDIRHQRFCQNEQHGGLTWRCESGIPGPVAANNSIFLHYLPAIQMASNKRQKEQICMNGFVLKACLNLSKQHYSLIVF